MKIQVLRDNSEIIESIVQSGFKDIYKTVQSSIRMMTGNTPSLGLISKYFRETGIKEVKPRLNYGKGKENSRVYKDQFYSDAGTLYVRSNKSSSGWVPAYIIAGNGSEYTTDDKDSDLVVHHKDGDHRNCLKNNLVLMTRSEHSSMHMKKYWKNKKQG